MITRLLSLFLLIGLILSTESIATESWHDRPPLKIRVIMDRPGHIEVGIIACIYDDSAHPTNLARCLRVMARLTGESIYDSFFYQFPVPTTEIQEERSMFVTFGPLINGSHQYRLVFDANTLSTLECDSEGVHILKFSQLTRAATYSSNNL